ncbi:uncharacterized protein LY89DRAFT_718744 [Mollisia scopiformis]|uniref:DUF6594 domain-containing protein n=1 Tax=Mollisia scopiformis TaxID=149040 RepID=A0A194XA61_MOLSC|nr:uncharacterized protein LY89DRAFT_718744 [Mollisia scopiformis]KUJ17056.1 hypothetical protein LY89DRAFT_718744 [Mollisia scopiformis]
MSGYTKLAKFMTQKHHPILRKFQHLATRDLLYLQAELCELDFKHDTIAKKDALETDERQYYGRDWQYLESSNQRGFGGEQWAVALATRAKLREYYAALSQYSQIASIPEPSPSERTILHDWIGSPAMGGGCGFLGRDLGGYEQLSVYEDLHQSDLAILSDAHGEDDLFTRFVTGPLLTLYHWILKRRRNPLAIDPENPPVGDNRSNLHHYDDRRIEMVTNILGTVFSSFAPLLSIVVLSFVSNAKARLGLVCAFTILFTCCLAVATKARRVEIFAASAAFASVQVVFIGSSNSNSIVL